MPHNKGGDGINSTKEYNKRGDKRGITPHKMWSKKEVWSLWWLKKHTNYSYVQLGEMYGRSKYAVNTKIQRDNLLMNPPQGEQPAELENYCRNMIKDYENSK